MFRLNCFLESPCPHEGSHVTQHFTLTKFVRSSLVNLSFLSPIHMVPATEPKRAKKKEFFPPLH